MEAWLIVLIMSSNTEHTRAFPFKSMEHCVAALQMSRVETGDGAENETGAVMFCAPDLENSRRHFGSAWWQDRLEPADD